LKERGKFYRYTKKVFEKLLLFGDKRKKGRKKKFKTATIYTKLILNLLRFNVNKRSGKSKKKGFLFTRSGMS
jgi:hypothetical protein